MRQRGRYGFFVNGSYCPVQYSFDSRYDEYKVFSDTMLSVTQIDILIEIMAQEVGRPKGMYKWSRFGTKPARKLGKIVYEGFCMNYNDLDYT